MTHETQMIRRRFVPKEDITTYELAQIVSMMLFPTGAMMPMAHEVRFTVGDFDRLPPAVARHFVP